MANEEKQAIRRTDLRKAAHNMVRAVAHNKLPTALATAALLGTMSGEAKATPSEPVKGSPEYQHAVDKLLHRAEKRLDHGRTVPYFKGFIDYAQPVSLDGQLISSLDRPYQLSHGSINVMAVRDLKSKTAKLRVMPLENADGSMANIRTDHEARNYPGPVPYGLHVGSPMNGNLSRGLVKYAPLGFANNESMRAIRDYHSAAPHQLHTGGTRDFNAPMNDVGQPLVDRDGYLQIGVAQPAELPQP